MPLAFHRRILLRVGLVLSLFGLAWSASHGARIFARGETAMPAAPDVPALAVVEETTPSPFYTYDILATLGDGVLGFSLLPSINDAGVVAFVGNTTISQVYGRSGSAVFHVAEPGGLVNLTPGGGPLYLTGGAQVGNDGKIAAYSSLRMSQDGEILILGTDVTLWQSGSSFAYLTTPVYGAWANDDLDDSNTPEWMNYVGRHPSVNNLGQVAAIAVNGPTAVTGGAATVDEITAEQLLLVTPMGATYADGQNRIELARNVPLSAVDELAPMVADDGRVVVREGPDPAAPIVVYDYELGVRDEVVGPSAGFAAVGSKPAISDSGNVVAYYADGADGPGVLVSVDDGRGFQTTNLHVVVAGQNAIKPKAELGWGEPVVTGPPASPMITYPPIFFQSFEMDRRLGVVHVDRDDKPGLDGDSVIVAFTGTPNRRSRLNRLTGRPFLFSERKGLWAARVDFESLPDGTLEATVASALPVAQLGDVLKGGRIDDLFIFDPIAAAAAETDGAPRDAIGRADHRIVFGAKSSIGPFIARATHLDTDEDGLMDHWEESGMDVDGNGVVDLELQKMGADPRRKDIFLEIDWTTQRLSGGTERWSNEPQAGVTERIAQMFNEAPVTNPDGSTGITLHIDAGDGDDRLEKPLSQNMPDPSLLEGGDLVFAEGSGGRHLDVVLFEDQFAKHRVPGVETETFFNLKSRFFGTTDTKARELAFHYTILADFQGFRTDAANEPFVSTATEADRFGVTSAAMLPAKTLNQFIFFTTGPASGQVRYIAFVDGQTLGWNEPLTREPRVGDSFTLLEGSSGVAEITFLEDDRSLPGNDSLVTLGGWGVNGGVTGSWFDQWKSLAHELGHNLRLKHCGFSPNEELCDDVTSGISIQTDGPLIVSEGSRTWVDDYRVVLNSAPLKPVTVTIDSGDQLNTSPSTLTFGPSDWSTPQRVEVWAVNDTVQEPVYPALEDPDIDFPFHVGRLSHKLTSGDVTFQGLETRLAVRVFDNERPGFIPLRGAKDEIRVQENGGTTTFQLMLTSKPAAAVRVDLSAVPAPNPVSVSPSSLVFDNLNWDVPQTVTLTAGDDNVGMFPLFDVEMTATSTDSNYNRLTGITFRLLDDDSPGIFFRESGDTTTVVEGGLGDSYDIRLAVKPSAGTSVTVTPRTSPEISFAPSSVTFTDANFDTLMNIRVSAVDDAKPGEGIERVRVNHDVESTDSLYDGLPSDPLVIEITDDDGSLEPDHRSLMSYGHSNATSGINDYAGPGDALLHEWSVLRTDFSSTFANLQSTVPTNPKLGGLDLAAYERLFGGPPDADGPQVTLLDSIAGVDVPLSGGLAVRALIRDESTLVGNVTVSVDVNGDGTLTTAEQLQATETSPDVFEAVFSGLAGAAGGRSVRIVAEDIRRNRTIEEAALNVVPAADNDPPVAADAFLATEINTPLAVPLSAVDPNGAPLTFSVVTLPTEGTVSGTAPDLLYTPTTDFVGFDQVTFRASDGLALSNVATVTIMVGEANAPPTIDPLPNLSVDEGTTLSVVVNASDPDADRIRFSGVGLPRFATLTDNANGTATLTLSPGVADVGGFGLEVVASDDLFQARLGVGGEVIEHNEAPVLNPIGDLRGVENFTVRVSISASDPDADELSFSSTGLPAFAQLIDAGTNYASLELSPVGVVDTGDYPGVTISVTDGVLTTSETITIRVPGDTGPPALEGASPLDGSTHLHGLGAVYLFVSEPLDAATITSAAFELTDSSGSSIPATGVDVRRFGTTIVLTFDPLPVETYTLTADAALITDLAGNPLGSGPLTVTRFDLIDTPSTFSSLYPDRVFRSAVGPEHVRVGDVNEDGNPDVVVAGLDTGVAVHLGNGDGTFAEHVSFFGAAKDVALDDVDGDGHLDLVTSSNNNVIGTVATRLGNGDGSFGARIEGTVVLPRPELVELADMDSDGLVDVIVGGSSVIVLAGNGDGTFTTQLPSPTAGEDFLLVADLDGDTHLDVVTAARGLTAVWVLQGSSTGLLTNPVQLPLSGAPLAGSLGDIDGDGDLDLLVTTIVTFGSYQASVEVLLGNGDRTFGPATTIDVMSESNGIVLADVDEDSRLDIVMTLERTSTLGAIDETDTVGVLLGNGDGTFGARTEIPSGRLPWPVAVDDFDGDGDLDVVAGNHAGASLSLLLGNGDGGFPIQPDVTAGLEPWSIASGDLNGDGDADLLSVNRDTVAPEGTATAFLGNGDGTFQAGVDYPVQRNPEHVRLRDLDNDAVLDAVLAHFGGGISVLPGVGDGSFGARVDYLDGVGANPVYFDFGDIDGDTDEDLVIATPDSNNVSILMSNGDGTFSPGLPVGNLSAMSSVALAELNGDGDLDMVIKLEASAFVGILTGNGDGTFSGPLTTLAVGNRDGAVLTDDVDADGDADIVTGSVNQIAFDGAQYVSILLSNGDGTFAPSVDYLVGSRPHRLALGRVNEDPHLDFLTSNLDEDSVSLWLGVGDGTFTSPTTYDVGSSPRDVTLGDWNGDGRLDFATANGGGFGADRIPGTLSPRLQLGGAPGASGLPEADAGADRSVGAGSIVQLDGSASTSPSPSSPLAFLWLQRSGPELTISAADTATPTFVAEVTGDYELELLVSADGFSDSDVVRVHVIGTPDLVLAITDGEALALPGDTLDYVINVTNVGNVGAEGVSVSTRLSDVVSFTSASDGGAVSGVDVSWPLVSLAAGASLSRSVTVQAAPVLPGGVNVIATSGSVSDDGTAGGDPTPDNNTAIDTNELLAFPDLAVSVDDGQSSALPAQSLTYAILATNTGSQGASGVLVELDAPANARVVFVSDGGTLDGGTIRWPLFSLDAGGSAPRAVTVELDAAWPPGVATLDAVARVSDDGTNGPDFDSSTNVAIDSNSVILPDLVVTVDDGETLVAPGQTLHYVISVTNVGGAAASGISLEDTIPPDGTFVSASDAGEELAGTVRWPSFDLAPGERAIREVEIQVIDPAPDSVSSFVNQVRALDDTSHGPDAEPGDNVAADDDLISRPSDLVITAVATPNPVVVGEQLTYTIEVKNEGSEPTAAFVRQLLPLASELVSASASIGSCQETTPVLCDVGLLEPSESATVVIVARTVEVGEITSVIAVLGSEIDPDTSNSRIELITNVRDAVPDEWNFTDETSASGLGTPSGKAGGLTWCDLNHDGFLDVLVNTDHAPPGSRLYFNNGDGTFDDVTLTHAPPLERYRAERSAICADINNDGYVDFARNSHDVIALYLNQGPSAEPPFSFVKHKSAHQVISKIYGGMNTEGMGFLDYDLDGDLDLIVDNHNYGVELFDNDGSGRMTHRTRHHDTLGLPASARSGDYSAVADFDADGWVDAVARKEDAFDVWRNTGGHFQAVSSFDLQASNANKGGVAWCDFDSDGDMDLAWTDAPGTRIWRNDGGAFVATEEPSGSSGVDLSGFDVDGVVCADVDNDIDVDLFLTSNIGESFLFLNETTPASGVIQFRRDNHDIAVLGNGEAAAFADADRDGDLDLLVNVDGASNQFWENHRNDAGTNDYLVVRALRCLGDAGGIPLYRDDVGATVRLFTADGITPIGPLQEVNGGRGHGSQNPPWVHFGLPRRGAGSPYVVEVQFIGDAGAPGPRRRETVTPSELGSYQLAHIKSCGGGNLAPLAYDVSATARPGGSVTVELSGLDPEAQPLSFEVVDGPRHGTLSGTGAALTYSANPDFTEDTFSYRSFDGVLHSATATVSLSASTAVFVEDASSRGLATGGGKQGGLAWCDFNEDGWLDVLVNTIDRSFLYFNDEGTFRDATRTHANGLRKRALPRSAICGDLNNDGHVDFARNAHNRIEIYYNRGPKAKTPFSFGRNKHGLPNQSIHRMHGGMNTEGMGLLDFDHDGDLDLIVDNHDHGIDLFRNNGHGRFVQVTKRRHSRGLPQHARSGDYLAVTDFDVDGLVDVVDRKEHQLDLWRNLGDGTFGVVSSFDANADNANKGGVAFCDFDADGDFDLFWTDADVSQIWRNDDGDFYPTGEPSRSSGITLAFDELDGVACADVDHDADLDLFLAAGSGASYLFLNETDPGSGSEIRFRRDNAQVDVDANGEGLAFGDFDRDGDLDLLLNVDRGPNQLWTSSTSDETPGSSLFIKARKCLPRGGLRDDIGATIRLFESDGLTPVGPVQEVNGGRGHGSQTPAVVHFGLPHGAARDYVVEVRFVGGPVVRRPVRPESLLGYPIVEVRDCSP